MRMADILSIFAPIPIYTRASPRRRPLTREECALLKGAILRRMKYEDYRCRMPDARVHYIGKVDDLCRPVYRLRLRTEYLRNQPSPFRFKAVSFRKVWL